MSEIVDSIQSKALRICYGAMKSTFIAALQVEYGEPPLDIGRLRLQLNYSIKLYNCNNNRAIEIINDSRRNYYGKTSNNYSNIYLNTSEFYGKPGKEIACARVGMCKLNYSLSKI